MAGQETLGHQDLSPLTTTFDVIHLGVLPIIDPVEGNITAENAAALTLLTIGSAGEPLVGYPQLPFARTTSPLETSGRTAP